MYNLLSSVNIFELICGKGDLTVLKKKVLGHIFSERLLQAFYHTDKVETKLRNCRANEYLEKMVKFLKKGLTVSLNNILFFQLR